MYSLCVVANAHRSCVWFFCRLNNKLIKNRRYFSFFSSVLPFDVERNVRLSLAIIMCWYIFSFSRFNDLPSFSDSPACNINCSEAGWYCSFFVFIGFVFFCSIIVLSLFVRLAIYSFFVFVLFLSSSLDFIVFEYVVRSHEINHKHFFLSSSRSRGTNQCLFSVRWK